MKKILTTVACVGLFLAVAPASFADLVTFQNGGDRLVNTQHTDGAWGWPLTAPPTYGNIHGPIGMGLAQAYHQTGDAGQLAALSSAGGYLLTKTNNFSASDGYLAAELDSIFGGTTYSDHVRTNFFDQLAAGTYNRNGLGTLYSTASYVNLIRTSRSGAIANLATWDLGMGLYAADLVGADTTDWANGVFAEIDELDGSGFYDVIGLAGGIFGLASVGLDFDPTSGEHAAASNINDLADILASYQIAGGGFTWNSGSVAPGEEVIQETAYAILALNAVDRAGYASEILGAANFIEAAQLGTGGWENYFGNGENNEVTGEALWALNTATPIPEPATMTLLGLGLAGLVARGRRKLS